MATILGVTMGLVSSEFSYWRRDKKKKNRKKNSTRTLISLENERNLELLKEFWYKLNKTEEKEEEDDDTLKIDLAHRLIKMPKPSWNNVMWSKQASLLAMTFTDKEIIGISSFNNCFEVLRSIYTKLIDLDTKDREYNSSYAGSGVDMSQLPRSVRFREEAPGLWDEFEKITLTLIDEGNPLNCKKTRK